MNYVKLLSKYDLSSYGITQVLHKLTYFPTPKTKAEFYEYVNDILDFVDSKNELRG